MMVKKYEQIVSNGYHGVFKKNPHSRSRKEDLAQEASFGGGNNQQT
jgi:hypothetical protein